MFDRSRPLFKTQALRAFSLPDFVANRCINPYLPTKRRTPRTGVSLTTGTTTQLTVYMTDSDARISDNRQTSASRTAGELDIGSTTGHVSRIVTCTCLPACATISASRWCNLAFNTLCLILRKVNIRLNNSDISTEVKNFTNTGRPASTIFTILRWRCISPVWFYIPGRSYRYELPAYLVGIVTTSSYKYPPTHRPVSAVPVIPGQPDTRK